MRSIALFGTTRLSIVSFNRPTQGPFLSAVLLATLACIGVAIIAMAASLPVNQAVQADDLQAASGMTVVSAELDTPWYASYFDKKKMMGVQADFREPLY